MRREVERLTGLVSERDAEIERLRGELAAVGPESVRTPRAELVEVVGAVVEEVRANVGLRVDVSRLEGANAKLRAELVAAAGQSAGDAKRIGELERRIKDGQAEAEKLRAERDSARKLCHVLFSYLRRDLQRRFWDDLPPKPEPR